MKEGIHSAPQGRSIPVEGVADDFDQWLTELEEDVIQGDYGYEPGEFSVFPDHWEPLWREGLTPAAAFRRAIDAASEAMREREDVRRANWQRIQEEEAALTARTAGNEADRRSKPK